MEILYARYVKSLIWSVLARVIHHFGNQKLVKIALTFSQTTKIFHDKIKMFFMKKSILHDKIKMFFMTKSILHDKIKMFFMTKSRQISWRFLWDDCEKQRTTFIAKCLSPLFLASAASEGDITAPTDEMEEEVLLEADTFEDEDSLYSDRGDHAPLNRICFLSQTDNRQLSRK